MKSTLWLSRKKHIPSLLALDEADNDILFELLHVIKMVARQVEEAWRMPNHYQSR
jgi:hypothetical protein